jgi:hypothetical protein
MEKKYISCIDKHKHRNHVIQLGTVSKVVRTKNALSNAGVIKLRPKKKISVFRVTLMKKIG